MTTKTKTARAKKTAGKKTSPPKRPLTVKQRDRVLDAAMKTLAAEGYDGFTAVRVAARAKLDPARIRAAFPSRLHLLAAALETNVERDSDETEALVLRDLDFKGDLTRAFAAMLGTQIRRHLNGGWLSLFANLDLAREEPEHADMWRMMEYRIGERGVRIVGEMQRRGYIDATLDPRWVQFFWNALMDGLAVRSRALPDGIGLDTVAESLAPIVLAGLAPKRA